MDETRQDDRGKAERVMSILAGVMSEENSDKSSAAYAVFRRLDAILRDRLYVELNRFGLGEGPEAMRMAGVLLQRAETACRFPELMRQNLVCLEVPFINHAFRGHACGLIAPIPELGGVQTVVPVLAIHGARLRIEYVNYAWNRREISLSDYAFLNRWAYLLKGLQLRRLIRNFVITAPQVMDRVAVLVTPVRKVSEDEARKRPPVDRHFGAFVGMTISAQSSRALPHIAKVGAYLGLKEQMECVNVLVRGGLWRDEYESREVVRAVTKDLVRRDGGDDAERAFFGRFRDEAKARMELSQQQLKVLDPILKSAMDVVSQLQRELHDFYNARTKRLQHYVVDCLCRIVEEHRKTGQKPDAYVGRLQTFGIDVDSDRRVLAAKERGEAARNARSIDRDELIEEGEKKLQRRTAGGPVRPTDVQLVPFKMAAAYGSTRALARLAGIFYETGRYSHDRKLVDAEEIRDARTLKFIVTRLIEKNYDVQENESRLVHIRRCLGELKSASVKRKPSANARVASSRGKSNTLRVSVPDDVEANEKRGEYDAKADYRTHRHYVGSSSDSCCFVTTAAVGALSVSAFERARAFVLMKRLRDVRLLGSERGRVLLATYYRVAPELVREMDASNDRVAVYRRLWREYILPCCECVRAGHLDLAEKIYIQMVETLLFDPFGTVCVAGSE